MEPTEELVLVVRYLCWKIGAQITLIFKLGTILATYVGLIVLVNVVWC